jgi:hypothetical protein
VYIALDSEAKRLPEGSRFGFVIPAKGGNPF